MVDTTKIQEVDKDVFELITQFLNFINTHNYGQFNVTVNSNQATGTRDFVIDIVEKKKKPKMKMLTTSYEVWGI